MRTTRVTRTCVYLQRGTFITHCQHRVGSGQGHDLPTARDAADEDCVLVPLSESWPRLGPEESKSDQAQGGHRSAACVRTPAIVCVAVAVAVAGYVRASSQRVWS